MSDPTTEPAKATARSPFAGCAIFIAVIVMMLFLIVISIVTFFRQYNEIAKFTDDKPVPIEITKIEDREADLNRLAERLETFRQDLVDGKDTSISLSAEDLNTAIAVYEPLKDFRGTFRVLEIGKENVRIAASFPLNGKPRKTRDGEPGLITTERRYLNGTIIGYPELFEGEVALQITDIQVPEKTVAKEFIERMSPHRVMERYTTDATLGPAMKKLTGVELADGNLVLRHKAGEKIVTSIDNKQVDIATSRLFKFFGVGASIFLIFVAAVIFLGLRKKSRDA